MDDTMFWTILNAFLKNCNKESVFELTTEEIKNEIEEVKGTISNERIWERGYDGDEPVNPHTANICVLSDYLGYLEDLLDSRENA